MIKRILLFSVFLGLFLYSTVSHAQWISRDVSLKLSLADFLYQYGKEIYNRGIDVQEASFVFQRALVLNCHHEGAQTYLNQLHKKYPSVSIRIWGCAEDEDATIVSQAIDTPENIEPTDQEDEPLQSKKQETSPAHGFQVVDQDTAQPIDAPLKERTQKLKKQIQSLEVESKEKDAEIERYKDQLSSEKPKKVASDSADDVSFSSIAQDQKDLIRVQQSNIDYLKSELADLKKQLQGGSHGPAVGEYSKAQLQVADSGLETEEVKTKLVSKDQEVKSLQQKLEDLQEELKLVQKIVDEKNKMIQSLQAGIKQ